MKNHIKFLKAFKKDLVDAIRGKNDLNLYSASWWFRHAHIAHCLIRGRTMEQIESYNREGNKPNEDFYKIFMSPDPEFPDSFAGRMWKQKFDKYVAWKEKKDVAG